MKTKTKSELPTRRQRSPVADEAIGSESLAERYRLLQAQELINAAIKAFERIELRRRMLRKNTKRKLRKQL